MNSVRPWAWANAWRSAQSPLAATRRCQAPRRLATGGRGRSAGSSSAVGAPARRRSSGELAFEPLALEPRHLPFGEVAVLEQRLGEESRAGSRRRWHTAPPARRRRSPSTRRRRRCGGRRPGGRGHPRPGGGARSATRDRRRCRTARRSPRRARCGAPTQDPPSREVGKAKADRPRRVDERDRAPVLLDEAGPEHLVAADDLGEGALECGHVEPAPQPRRPRDVVGAASAGDLLDEPEPLLRVGRATCADGRGDARSESRGRPARGAAISTTTGSGAPVCAAMW